MFRELIRPTSADSPPAGMTGGKYPTPQQAQFADKSRQDISAWFKNVQSTPRLCARWKTACSKQPKIRLQSWGGCPTALGGTSSPIAARHWEISTSSAEQVPPRGWRNLPLRQGGGT